MAPQAMKKPPAKVLSPGLMPPEICGQPPFVLKRPEAYIGVMIDDL